MTTALNGAQPSVRRRAANDLARTGARLKTVAAEAADQARDTLDRARENFEPVMEKTTALAQSAGRQVKSAGMAATQTVRRSPVTTVLAVAGAGVGLFLLLNGRTRALAVGAALRLWRNHGAGLSEDFIRRLTHAIASRR